jgi:pilus assembly protein CpaC
MQRNIAKQFGIDLASAAIVAGVPIAASSAPQFALVGAALNDLMGAGAGQVCNVGSTATNPLAALGGSGVCNVGPNNLSGTLKALESVGLVHLLAEPNLTAVSGETAKFLAGGEFPVPVNRDGNVTIEFKQFGVGLSFTPVVLSAGRISLQVSTEVSELTNTGSFTLQGSTANNGQTIPALSVRRTETTVELPSGGSFAIAGLMQHNYKQVIEALPGVKDMPILGALFRSRDYQNDETELVVIISAYLVNPTMAASLASPTDGFIAPTDAESILLGRLNSVYNKPAGDAAKPNASGSVGFIVQ